VDVDRMLDRASEIVDQVVIPNAVDVDDADHMEAAKKAACAIVEYWLEVGEQESIIGQVAEYQVGSVRVRYNKDSKPSCDLPARARRHLLTAGLLYAGVPD
jgi:hypothetical protein